MIFRGRRLEKDVAQVVASQNCSGCGACCQLDPSLSMRLDAQGFLRPVWSPDPTRPEAKPGARAAFRAVCPGLSVRAPRPAGSYRHPQLGPIIGAWQAWAADDEIRRVGSSGGVLTALASWLLETGVATQVVGARGDAQEPRKTVSVTITSREEAISSAGSRYAPVAVAANPRAMWPGTVVVGKPCEVAALRGLSRIGWGLGAGDPVLLSFFCAGTPSQSATDGLVRHLGVDGDDRIRQMWYRGRGWPGRFTITTDDKCIDMSYEESWGQHLGPAVQWRCKVCVDGVGESADIVAGDFWHSNHGGYPNFSEAPGVSALIARTERGHELLTQARRDGAIIAYPIDPGDIVTVQPLQRQRRATLPGRLLGTLAGGRRVPAYRGFQLWRYAVHAPRTQLRAAGMAMRKVHASKRELSAVTPDDRGAAHSVAHDA